MAMKENSKKVLNYLKEVNGQAVTAQDVADALEANNGIVIDKKKINIPNPIKAYGKYSVEIKILQDIGAKFTVTVSE